MNRVFGAPCSSMRYPGLLTFYRCEASKEVENARLATEDNVGVFAAQYDEASEEA